MQRSRILQDQLPVFSASATGAAWAVTKAGAMATDECLGCAQREQLARERGGGERERADTCAALALDTGAERAAADRAVHVTRR
ncbi:hypothetical protein FGB62_21g24 [Gracilaria domingensis]|nr:hypothetical protein FGB62_21g24 [Gracilaria domingensis]